jgi:hypothetical protein
MPKKSPTDAQTRREIAAGKKALKKHAVEAKEEAAALKPAEKRVRVSEIDTPSKELGKQLASSPVTTAAELRERARDRPLTACGDVFLPDQVKAQIELVNYWLAPITITRAQLARENEKRRQAFGNV